MRIIKTAGCLLTAAFLAIPSLVPASELDGENISMAFADINFVPFGDGPMKIGVLWGDPATGPSGFLLRVPAGFETPLHTHSANYCALVVHGQHQHWDQTENKIDVHPISAGAYVQQAGGHIHADANPTGAESVVLVIFDGPFDFILPE